MFGRRVMEACQGALNGRTWVDLRWSPHPRFSLFSHHISDMQTDPEILARRLNRWVAVLRRPGWSLLRDLCFRRAFSARCSGCLRWCSAVNSVTLAIALPTSFRTFFFFFPQPFFWWPTSCVINLNMHRIIYKLSWGVHKLIRGLQKLSAETSYGVR